MVSEEGNVNGILNWGPAGSYPRFCRLMRLAKSSWSSPSNLSLHNSKLYPNNHHGALTITRLNIIIFLASAMISIPSVGAIALSAAPSAAPSVEDQDYEA
jgi:hypothetical protein